MIPVVAKMCSGIPCTSVTTISSRCSENVNCVQESRGATGIGFHELLAAIEAQWPLVSQMECVTKLLRNVGGVSDADWMCAEMRRRGYWSIHCLLDDGDAADCSRARLWWVSALKLKGNRLTIDAFFRKKCCRGSP